MSKNASTNKKTLDTLHLTKLKEFQERENTVKNLSENIEKLSATVQAYKARCGELSDEEFESYMQMIDELNALKKRLSKYENHDEEVEYYMNTAPILFQYYDILENGKDNATKAVVHTENSILKYFMKPAGSNEPQMPSTSNIDRASLLDKYLHITDPNYIKPIEIDNSKDKCPHCSSVDRNIMLNDGMIYCNNCHSIENIIIDHERPSYKDPPKEMDPPKECCGFAKDPPSLFFDVSKSMCTEHMLVACC